MTMTSRPTTSPVEPAVTPQRGRAADAVRANLGLLAAIVSAASFGTAGPFAKSLLHAGWTPGAVVLIRISVAGLILLPFAATAMHGRWTVLRANARLIAIFGVVSVALPQLAYAQAVQRLSVGVALLLEYSGVVLVVLFVWWRTGRAPSPLTTLGALVALGGLAFVLGIGSGTSLDLVGVLWGLAAAVGLAAYFLTAGHGDGTLPPVALAAFGMVVGGVSLGVLGLLRVLPMTFATEDVVIAGSPWPWWTALLELAAIAAAAAYLLGTYAVRRLGATVSSFVGLSEVLFAILFAWLLLGEMLQPSQLLGGLLVVAGVVGVKVGEARTA